nr:helix-turn-helix transcriptional regulator [uncultured Acetatifactor sp.]
MLQDIETQIRESKGNITLSECADALGVHPTYVWKVLKMEKGKSFMDYVEEYKLEEAMRLLLQTDLTVAEIAVRLNYTNAQNFIRFFSKSTGVTPGKFRKLY